MPLPRSVLKIIVRIRQWVHKHWQSNSGDWQWLAEKKAPIVGLNRLLWRESVPSLSFFVMLALSGVIAAMGLLAGSTATVIGAMIIAPLMGPIIGLAYAVTVLNRRLMKRAGLTLIMGIVVTVVSAAVICQITGIRGLSSEILMRSQPTLLDLGVALAAGAAGAFAKSRKHVADAFPGVAISVALVPPLSVIGIGFTVSNPDVWAGAALLFLTNLTGIIFSGMVVFLWQGYGTLARAQSGMILSLLMLSIIGVPLGLSLNNLLIQEDARQKVRQLIEQELPNSPSVDLRSLSVQRRSGVLRIAIEVTAPPNMITENQVRSLQEALVKTLKQPVRLHLRTIPTQEFLIQSRYLTPEMDSIG